MQRIFRGSRVIQSFDIKTNNSNSDVSNKMSILKELSLPEFPLSRYKPINEEPSLGTSVNVFTWPRRRRCLLRAADPGTGRPGRFWCTCPV